MNEQLRTARNVVEAVFEEMLLWARTPPIEYLTYEKLRGALASRKLENSPLSDDLKKKLRATNPFWGADDKGERLREIYQEMRTNPETRAEIQMLVGDLQRGDHLD